MFCEMVSRPAWGLHKFHLRLDELELASPEELDPGVQVPTQSDVLEITL